MKSIFRVTMTSVNQRTHEPYWINFECDHETVASLTSDLNEGKLVLGDSLRTARSGEEGVLEITSRKTVALGRPGIALIETPSFRFVEYVEQGNG